MVLNFMQGGRRRNVNVGRMYMPGYGGGMGGGGFGRRRFRF